MNSSSDFINGFISKSEDEQKKAALGMLSGLDSKQSEQVRSILGDREKLAKLLSSPQAQQLIKKLKGSSDGQHK